MEGSVTEPGYVAHLARRFRQHTTIEQVPDVGAPLQLVRQAVERKRQDMREERRGKGRAYDEVWCVFDVDEHPKMAEAISLARQNDICLAVSNPCIELWFVLHFRDQTAHIERKAAQAASKTLLKCDKRLTDAALSVLDAREDEAEQRAQRLDRKHDGDGSPRGANPSSSVWKLVASIERR